MDEQFVLDGSIAFFGAGNGRQKGLKREFIERLARAAIDFDDLVTGRMSIASFVDTQSDFVSRFEWLEYDGASFCAVDFKAPCGGSRFEGRDVEEGDGLVEFVDGDGIVDDVSGVAVVAEEGRYGVRPSEQPADLI